MINTKDYLDRIGFTGNVNLDLDTLHKLIECHIYSVPYENLDIINGKPLSLDIEDILEKIVTNHRGGYCFELNYAFTWLLQSLGFTVTEYFARFLLGLDYIPMPRHRVLEVTIDGKQYLCDVGVGIETLRFPMLVQDGNMQGNYRITFDDKLGVLLSELHKGEWRQYFSYIKTLALPVDFVATSFYCEKSPESIFNKENMISIKTPTGRKTIDGNRFKIFDYENVTECVLDENQLIEVFNKEFGIRL